MANGIKTKFPAGCRASVIGVPLPDFNSYHSSPLGVILTLCSRHTGLFLEQSKLVPSSGPLYVLFCLPGRRLPGSPRGELLLIFQTLALDSPQVGLPWSPIRTDPSYLNRHCTYSFYFGHSSIKTNLYLIRQAWELLKDSTLSLLLACSMLYPGGLVEDFAHGQLSVNWVYWIFVCHSVLRRGLGVKETGAALLEKH